jgi:hypothetical protein
MSQTSDGHSESVPHTRQLIIVVSHTGSAAKHWLDSKHATQVSAGEQCGKDDGQSVSTVHCGGGGAASIGGAVVQP